MAKPPKSVRDRVIDAALKLAAEKPWGRTTLGEIAKAARISLEALNGEFSSKTSIVVAIMERTNATMLGGIDSTTESEPVHDRLLDAILRRLDSLQAHKSAICSILRDLPSDPAGLICLAPGFYNAMAWTLEAAGIGSSGLGGRLRVKGLGAIYLGALRVWSRDESEDQGKTLAYLDRRLKQAEKLVRFLPDDNMFSQRRSRPEETDTE